MIIEISKIADMANFLANKFKVYAIASGKIGK